MVAVVRDLPRSLAGAALREIAGKYPTLPWIPYPAIRALAKLSRPDWHVLEHGAGMSTVWWAKRVNSIHSIEANADWYQRLKEEIRHRRLDNVTLEHRTGDDYGDLSAFKDHSFQLVVIDGHAREKAAEQATRLITRPGWIYLDNTDFAAQWQEMYGEAENILRGAASRDRAEMTYFTGFPPATFIANQGLLISYR